MRHINHRPVSERRTPGEGFAGSFSGSVAPESAGVPSAKKPEHLACSCPVSSEVRLGAFVSSLLCLSLYEKIKKKLLSVAAPNAGVDS